MSLLWRTAMVRSAGWAPTNEVEHMHPSELDPWETKHSVGSKHVGKLASSIKMHGYDPTRHGHLGLNVTDHGENWYTHAPGTETEPEHLHHHADLLIHALHESGHDQPVPVHVHDQRSDEGGEPAPKLYHGTTAEDLDAIHPNHGTSGNFGAATHEPGYAYATGLKSAWHYATRAADHYGGTPHVYEVNPRGPIEEDPMYQNGYSRGNNADDVRSKHGFDVVGEEEMPEHLRDHYSEHEDEDHDEDDW